ncbi:MAG: hypothetical protein MUC96_08560 [Myxococcaceae bacterium]|jgi:DNA-binding MarR family transcriptional regulator|nr:hypothetical protein [Myxococcaceae bacterium]
MHTDDNVVEQQQLFSLMARVERRYRAHVKDRLEFLGVTTREYELLRIVQRQGSPAPASIARSAAVSRQLVHRLLTELARRDLVQKWSPSDDPSDVRVGLTRAAEELLADASAVVETVQQTVLRTLGVERQMALASLLGALEAALVEVHRRPEPADH